MGVVCGSGDGGGMMIGGGEKGGGGNGRGEGKVANVGKYEVKGGKREGVMLMLKTLWW